MDKAKREVTMKNYNSIGEITMKNSTEIESKIAIPNEKLRDVIHAFGNKLDNDGSISVKGKIDFYFKDNHNDIGYNNKVLRIRETTDCGEHKYKSADRLFTNGVICLLEQNDIKEFYKKYFPFSLISDFAKIQMTAKIKSTINGYENNIEKEIKYDRCSYTESIDLLKILGFKVKFGKNKFSIFHEMTTEPFNVELVYCSKLAFTDKDEEEYSKNGVWYAEIETTQDLQIKQGVYDDWTDEEYEARIDRLFLTLGLDPSKKDNRSWKEILNIEDES